MKILLFGFVCVWIAGPALLAQNTPGAPEPPELVARRGEFLRSMARVEIQPLSQYLHDLDLLKQQLLREGKSGAAIAIDAEMKDIQEQLAAAQTASNLANAGPMQFQIDNATYGDAKTKRVQDVTPAVQSAVDSGATMVVNAPSLGVRDPAPGTDKFLVVNYRVNGAHKQKTFKERSTVNLKQELR